MELTGNIRKIDYDKIIDIEKIEFRDTNHNINGYIEIPRSIASFEGSSSISVLITDETQDYSSDTKIVFNSTLYLVRRDTEINENRVIQFSAGGLLLRLITENTKSPFRLRGNRKFKIIVN